MWIGAVVGCAAYVGVLRWGPAGSGPATDSRELTWPWLDITTIAAGALAAGGLLGWRRGRGRRNGEAQAPLKNGATDGSEPPFPDPETVLRWVAAPEQPVAHPSEDLFGMDVVARRVARLLAEKPVKTIALVGPFGCGKTSLLNLVERMLSDFAGSRTSRAGDEVEAAAALEGTRVLFCRIGGWGLRSGSAADHVLSQAVQVLGGHVDCLGLAGLPAHYRSAVSEVGPPWLKSLCQLLSPPRDPRDVLARLDSVLECVGRRLVVCLEDLDRNQTDDALWDEVESLLDRLKGLKNVSFVLATVPDKRPTDVVVRICSHIETFPPLAVEDVLRVCERFRDHSLGEFPKDVDCLFPERRQLRSALAYNTVPAPRRLSAQGGYTQLGEAVAGLLATPRLLRLALRRASDAWRSLHGEIDFDDLLAGNVLRAGAPEAYSFVLKSIERIRGLRVRDEADSALQESRQTETEMKAEWDACIAEGQERNRFAARVMGALFPSWPNDWGKAYHPTPQGVAVSEPVDYWARLNAEEIPAGEMRDQVVLKAFCMWRDCREAEVHGGRTLAGALHSDRAFAARVKHLGKHLLSPEELRELAHDLFSLCLEEKGGYPGDPEPWQHDLPQGFVELWTLSLDLRIDETDHEWWVFEEIKRALPISLRFANDLYYYWRNQESGGVGETMPQPELQSGVVSEAERLFSGSPEALVRVLDESCPEAVSRFFIFLGGRDQEATGTEPGEWTWLGDVLLDAAEQQPAIVLPQMACLLVDVGGGPGAKTLSLSMATAERLFGSELRRLMERLAVRLADAGDLDAETVSKLELVQGTAEKWLAEHQEDASCRQPDAQ